MVFVDVPKVRGKMAEKGYNITSLSDLLGINRNTLTLYLETPGKMPYGVVSKMAEILCDDPNDAISIFFATDLRNMKVSDE